MADDARHRTADLERLLDVARSLGATVELDPLLETIVAAATSVLDCERATVFLYDREAGELRSRLATGIAGSPLAEIRFPATRGIAGEVARTGRAINLPDAYADPRFNPEFDRQSGFVTRTMLSIPLSGHDGTTVGVLQVLNKRGGPFGDRDEEVAGFLGSQAGVAIQRQTLLGHYAEKQRLERDLSIARGIQQALLPREQPRLPGFDIAGWNRPADETGGDSFDFFPLEDGDVAVTLADATGHGIGPALIAAEKRALFRAFVKQSRDPRLIAEQVNDLLGQDLSEGRFVTAFLGIVSGGRSSVRYVSAGQGPLLLYVAATGELRELPSHGVPLGLFPGFEYEETTEQVLAPGDVLVLLTDGFYEWAREDGAMFGSQRVHDIVRRHHDRPSAEVIEILHRAVVAFAAGTPQADDLTAVIVRRLPEA